MLSQSLADEFQRESLVVMDKNGAVVTNAHAPVGKRKQCDGG